eukprot:jgi/Botrbrau1/3147/Bobra.0070s0114.2
MYSYAFWMIACTAAALLLAVCAVVLRGAGGWLNGKQKEVEQQLDMTEASPLSPTSTSSLGSVFFSRTKQQWELGVLEEADIKLVHGDDGKVCQLGCGASGEVIEGLVRGVQRVAIKVLHNINVDTPRQDKILKEVAVLRACRHPHIVSFQGVTFLENEVWLIMELMEGGDLAHALWLGKTYRWTKRGPQIAYDIASALAYLHANNLIHLDVKSPNVLLTKDGRAKLGDVGLTTWLTALQTHTTLPCLAGTFPYVAPEVLVFGQAGCSADIFSFGVILW